MVEYTVPPVSPGNDAVADAGQVELAPVVRRVPDSPRPRRRSQALWFVAASLGSALLSLGSLRLFGDDLDTDARGALRAILSALGGFAFFSTGLQIAYASMLLPPRGPVWSLRDLRIVAIGVGVGSGAIALAAGLVWLPEGEGGPWVALLTALYVLLSGYAALPRARLLVREQWARLAIVLCAGSLVKFVGAIVGHRSGSIIGVLVGLAVAETVGVLVAERLASPTMKSVDAQGHHRELRPLVVALVSLGGLWLLGSLDSVLARLRMPEAAADTYAAASSLSRPVILVATIVCWLAFPRFISDEYGSASLRRALWWSMLIAAVSSAVFAIVVGGFPSQLLHLTTPDVELVSVQSARLLAAAWALLGVSSVLVFFHVAQRSRMAFAPWIGTATILAGAPWCAERPRELAALVVVAAAATFLTLLLPAVLRVRPVVHSIQAHERPAAPRTHLAHDVAVIVPSYNPGPAVVTTIERIALSLGAVAESFEVIAVSDGSTDGSPDLIDALDHPWLRHVRCTENAGKGMAIRKGFAVARAGVVGFIDADGDLPPEQLPLYVRAFDDYDADVVMASKRHPDSELNVPRLRKLYSMGFQSLVRLLFRLDIRDTQTGLKLFTRDLVEQVLPSLQEDGFALDLELLVAARAHGFTRIVELPVRLEHQFNSTVSSRSVVQMFSSTLRIFWHSRMSLRYVRLAQTTTEPGPVDG